MLLAKCHLALSLLHETFPQNLYVFSKYMYDEASTQTLINIISFFNPAAKMDVFHLG